MKNRLKLLLICTLTSALILSANVYADDGGEIVFDDYVTEGEEVSENAIEDTEEMIPDDSVDVSVVAVDEESEEEIEAAMEEAGVSADSDAVTEQTGETELYIYDAEAAEAENTDSDDTYVSNTGLVFTIPRVDTSESLRVYDYAGLLTGTQVSELQAKLEQIAGKKNADIVILTSRDVPMDASYGTETTRHYAEQFYLDNFWGGVDDEGDALIFMIDMSNRVLWTMGHGKYADEKYVSFEEEVYDAAMSRARNGDYYGAADQFLEKTKRLDNILYKILPSPISLILSSLISLFTMLVLNLRHKSSQPSKANTPRIKVNNYRKEAHRKNFLGTRTTRRRISRDTDSGGGGGGFSGGVSSGGGFSGGGGSFSGGGGHF